MLVIAGVLTHVGRKNGCLRVLQLCEWCHMIWSSVCGKQELRGTNRAVTIVIISSSGIESIYDTYFI